MSKPTTKVLPIGSQKIDGNQSYEKILGYFTTKDIGPNEVHDLGWKMVNTLYPEVCLYVLTRSLLLSLSACVVNSLCAPVAGANFPGLCANR